MITRTTLRGPALRRFVGRYLELVVAAVAGMAVLGPVESCCSRRCGWARSRPPGCCSSATR